MGGNGAAGGMGGGASGWFLGTQWVPPRISTFGPSHKTAESSEEGGGKEGGVGGGESGAMHVTVISLITASECELASMWSKVKERLGGRLTLTV